MRDERRDPRRRADRPAGGTSRPDRRALGIRAPEFLIGRYVEVEMRVRSHRATPVRAAADTAIGTVAG